MKDTAIAYLMKNPLLHMDMIEAIRRNTADILYSGKDGILLKEQNSNAYMISADSFEKGRELIDRISECNLIAAHQICMADYITEKFGLTERIECVQAVYTGKSRLDVKGELEIRKLEPSQINAVLENYDKLSEGEIEKILRNGNLYGGYKKGMLVGFVGEHLEGSIGLLKVFTQYRRFGYGTALESFMVNKTLEKGFVPFGQVETDNAKSMAMQSKLGFETSKDRLYWMSL